MCELVEAIVTVPLPPISRGEVLPAGVKEPLHVARLVRI